MPGPIETGQLAAILHRIHERIDVETSESPLPALFADLGIDPEAAFTAANAVAFRVLTARAGRVLEREDLGPDESEFMKWMAAAFLDGLAAGRASLGYGSFIEDDDPGGNQPVSGETEGSGI